MCGNFDLSTNPFFILKSTKAPDKKDKRTTGASAVDLRKSGSKSWGEEVQMKATIKLTKRQKYNCSNWRFKARYSTFVLLY